MKFHPTAHCDSVNIIEDYSIQYLELSYGDAIRFNLMQNLINQELFTIV